MDSVPVDDEIRSLTMEGLLGRVRDGLRAEEEVIGRYLDIYGQKDATALLILKAIFRDAAEKAGTDVLSLVGLLLLERRAEIARLLEDFSSPTSYEGEVLRKVRREIWRLCKSRRRGPSFGDPRIEVVGKKGYERGGDGDAVTSLLFKYRDESLESALSRTQGRTEPERRLNQVLARLHVLKGWEYGKLARLVFGPDQEPDQLRKNSDKIRKWIQEPIRHVRAEKKRNELKQKKRRFGPGDEDGGLQNDGQSSGDDRP